MLARFAKKRGRRKAIPVDLPNEAGSAGCQKLVPPEKRNACVWSPVTLDSTKA